MWNLWKLLLFLRWMCHHYCAMLMSLISLTWEIKGQPDCSRKQRGVELFLCWAIMQGFAMMLQNRYQRQRLYTRIALGKARRMDVVWGETAGVEGQLLLLCPVLFLLQGFEGYVGFLLLRTAHTGIVPEWQVVVCGVLLIAMAIGNFANTVDTLMAKSRFKAKKRSRGKRDPDTCNSPTGLSPTNSTARAWYGSGEKNSPFYEHFPCSSRACYYHCKALVSWPPAPSPDCLCQRSYSCNQLMIRLLMVSGWGNQE